MTLWILLSIVAVWAGLCAVAASLCVMAGRADRVTAVKLRAVPDRHTLRRRRGSREADELRLREQRRERRVRGAQLVE